MSLLEGTSLELGIAGSVDRRVAAPDFGILVDGVARVQASLAARTSRPSKSS
jgi:hypothetical protein